MDNVQTLTDRARALLGSLYCIRVPEHRGVTGELYEADKDKPTVERFAALASSPHEDTTKAKRSRALENLYHACEWLFTEPDWAEYGRLSVGSDWSDGDREVMLNAMLAVHGVSREDDTARNTDGTPYRGVSDGAAMCEDDKEEAK